MAGFRLFALAASLALAVALLPAAAQAFPTYQVTFADDFNGSVFPKTTPGYTGAWGSALLVEPTNDPQYGYVKQAPGNGSTGVEVYVGPQNARAELNCYAVNQPPGPRCAGNEGDELYYEFDLRVPSGQNLLNPCPTQTDCEVPSVLQLKPVNVRSGCSGYGGSINVSNIEGDTAAVAGTYRLEIRIRGGNRGPAPECAGASDRKFFLGTFTKDAWHRVGLRVKVHRDASVGFVEVEVDGAQKLPKTSVPTFFGDASQMHFRLGTYLGRPQGKAFKFQYDNFRAGVPGASAPAVSHENLYGRPLGAAAHSNGEQYVFWRGGDGALWEAFWGGGRWHGPLSLGIGGLGSSPAAAVRPNGEQNVFWRSPDGNLCRAYYANGVWNREVIPGMGPLGSQPTATAWGSELNVYWKGADGGLWYAWNGGGRWHGPFHLAQAGTLGSQPTVASQSDGEQHIYWRGTDNHLWQLWWAGGSWHGPQHLGMGPLGSAPTAVIRPNNREQRIYWKGADGNLWEAYWNGSRWVGPNHRGYGVMGSAPAVAAWGSEIDVFWRGGDSHLWQAFMTGDGWWHGPFWRGMGPIP